MIRFYIVRHGQTLLNSLDRAQGWADSPLTEAGKQMAADIGQRLKGIDFDAAYASPLYYHENSHPVSVIIRAVSVFVYGFCLRVSTFA